MKETHAHIYAITNANEIGNFKLGMTTCSNPIERINYFKTGVSVPWKVEMIIRVPRSKICYIDNQIKKMLERYNVKKDGGTEFFTLTPEGLSVFKTMFLFYNPDCIEVDQAEIAEMENKPNTTRGKRKRRDRDNNDPDLVKIGPNGDSISKKTYERYMRTFEISRRTKRIHFAGKLNIKPFAGRNNLLERIPLDLEDVNSVKIWLDEVQYITTEYKDKYETGKGNKISDVTMGNGDLRALLRKYI
jgi:hypothetical protein